MFGLWRRIQENIRESLRDNSRYFRQYVGEETILMYGRDELFIYLDGRDASLTPCLLREGTWEQAIGTWIGKTLPAGGCFVDIGANNGIHALRAARKVGPAGTVIAFEPQERLVRLIERSACANLMLYYLHRRRMAIGASEGTVRLGKFAHLSGSASLTPNQLIIEHEEVPMAPLPLALRQVSAEIGQPCEPDVIKIDVEGFECDVWDGMKEWTRPRPQLAIIIEYSPVSYYDIGKDALRLLEEFGEYGFAIAALNADGTTRPVAGAQLEEMALARRQFDLVLTKG